MSPLEAAATALALAFGGRGMSDAQAIRAAAFVVDEAKANCAAERPGDHDIQGYCVKQHADSLIAFLDMLGQDPPEHIRAISAHCQARWPGMVAGVDWPMAVWCFEQRLAAYKALHGTD